jgi:asparagine synthase (glutamine-hydrolysing)
MCGLCGVVYADPGRPADPRMLRRMTDTMIHRGPDGDGCFAAPGIGLGFRRLSIIDLEHGDQPIASEDGAVVVVCNGEIYNYVELRRSLEAAGHRFRTNSDVEVIVHLYEDHGVRCTDFLRGMFAFALWDSRQRRLMLARDRFGIKPLNYAVTSDALYFGSEFKAILAGGDVDRDVDAGAMRDLFSVGFVLGPKTLLRAVRQLPPAHHLLYESGRIALRRYWDLPFAAIGDEGPRRSAGQWADAVRAKLEESVRLHLRSDVPVGAYLSSGIDSSAVAALMRQPGSGPTPTFSVAFEDPRFDEIGTNRILADFPGQDLHSHVVTCTTADFDLLPKAIWHQEDPGLASNGVPHLLLAKMAARHVKVVLAGEGSDEVFGGYRWHHVERLLAPFLGLPPGFRRAVAGIPFLRRRWSRASRAFAAPGKMGLDRYRQIIDRPPVSRADALFAADFRHDERRAGEADDALPLPEAFARWPRFAQLQYVEINSRMADFINRNLDASSMAYGVEARVPFLDHEFVELCCRIPPALKMRRLEEKHVLRRAMVGVLPAEIRARPKRGLMGPLWPWQGRLPDFVADAMSGPRLRATGYFDAGHVERLLDARRRGNRNVEGELAAILGVQLWDPMFRRGGRAP